MSADVNPGEFEQLVPLQSNPCFRHVHLLGSQVDLQLHLIIFSNFTGAAGSFDFRGKRLLSNVTGVGSGGGGMCPPPPPPHFFASGGQWYVCAPPLFTPHFHFSLELYVYIKLTNNYLAFFIYQLIILWTISIN